MELIPNRNLYFIGEIHLGQILSPIVQSRFFQKYAEFPPKEEILPLIQFDTLIKKQVLDSLIKSKQVSKILVECPPYIEFFVRKYKETNDSLYLSYIINYFGDSEDNYGHYEASELLTYASVLEANQLPVENLQGIDASEKYGSSFDELSKVLYALFLYEPNHKESTIFFTPEIDNTIYAQINKDYDEFILPLREDILFDLGVVIHGSYSSTRWRKHLYKELDKLTKNELAKKELQIRLGKWYDLFMRISYSYLDSYNMKRGTLLKDLSNPMDKSREKVIEKSISRICNDSSKCCVIIGSAHVKRSEEFHYNVTSALRAKKEIPFYCLTIYYQHKKLEFAYLNYIGLDISKIPKKEDKCRFLLYPINEEEALIY